MFPNLIYMNNEDLALNNLQLVDMPYETYINLKQN